MQIFKSKADTAVRAKGWCAYLIYGTDADGGYSPISSNTVRAGLVYLKAHPDKFWVTSFRNAASESEIQATADSVTVNVTDTLDNSIYNCPITIRRPLPHNWTSAVALQNGDTIVSQIIQVDSVTYVIFDVVPDHGNISIIKSYATGVELQDNLIIPNSSILYQNYPNPFNTTTNIEYQIAYMGFITLKVYDLLGRDVVTLFEGVQQPGSYEAIFNGSKLASGVYLYRLFTGSYVQTKKLILMK